ncbi:hypothetical protein ANN_12339 [Periplaneta americana]|uniref:Reverse transcriptase n=1 Tax=Periplaneta americana TaxID=6978 RepID=A0ABQ8TII6_PERAM|nr:hypothetical protein ANN_12339 [Periplaneta americana]
MNWYEKDVEMSRQWAIITIVTLFMDLDQMDDPFRSQLSSSSFNDVLFPKVWYDTTADRKFEVILAVEKLTLQGNLCPSTGYTTRGMSNRPVVCGNHTTPGYRGSTVRSEPASSLPYKAVIPTAGLPIRAVPGRSQDKGCRHCHNEVETLAHVLGSCPHGEGLRNARHYQVRSIIATALKDADYNTFEEVHCLSVTGTTRRIDIIAFKESTRNLCVSKRMKPAEVDNEKRISTILPFPITSKSTS